MSVNVLRIAAVLYLGAAAAYILFFARPRHVRAAVTGYWLAVAAFVVHAISIGIACAEFGGAEFFNLRGGFGMLGWLAAAAFLVLLRFWRLPSVGAFVLPLVLVAVMPGVFAADPAARGPVPEIIRLRTMPVHIFAGTGGVALFALAFAAALMYLLQEREVKGKHFGALFSRLPSLGALDRVTHVLVRLGFAVYTVAFISGSIVAKKAWGTSWDWDAQQVAALVIWLLYGLMVVLHRVGVHGRRYAVLTLVGFALVLTSMLGVRNAPGMTKHKGTYQARPPAAAFPVQSPTVPARVVP